MTVTSNVVDLIKRKPQLDQKHRGLGTPYRTSDGLPDYYDRYDLGVFIDDKRGLEDFLELNTVPDCDEWVILRSYEAVVDFLKTMVKRDRVFVSFDHQLSPIPKARTGESCMFGFFALRHQVGNVVDIQGHSSDPSKNDAKIQFWYKDYV